MIGMYTNFSCEARFPYNPILHYARGSFMKENNSLLLGLRPCFRIARGNTKIYILLFNWNFLNKSRFILPIKETISIQNPILYYAYSSVREQDDGANKRFLSCLMLCFRLIWGCMEIFLDRITLGLKIINFPCQWRDIALILLNVKRFSKT